MRQKIWTLLKYDGRRIIIVAKYEGVGKQIQI